MCQTPPPSGSDDSLLSGSEGEPLPLNAQFISIDLIVRDKQGFFLLEPRGNELPTNQLMVPGGLLQKGESLDDGFRRIVQDKLKVTKQRADSVLFGVFEADYKVTWFGKPEFGTQSLVLAYEVVFAERPGAPAVGSDPGAWWSAADILASRNVHEFTKSYFYTTAVRSENQYTALSARRNTSNTLLWQTPALSLAALAFLLNVAGNENTHSEVRLVACGLAIAISFVTLQLFLRHRNFEKAESKLLGEFELMNRHMGYARINAPEDKDAPQDNVLDFLAKYKSHKWWRTLFILFLVGSSYLLWLNWHNRNVWLDIDSTAPSVNQPRDVPSATNGQPSAPSTTTNPPPK